MCVCVVCVRARGRVGVSEKRKEKLNCTQCPTGGGFRSSIRGDRCLRVGTEHLNGRRRPLVCDGELLFLVSLAYQRADDSLIEKKLVLLSHAERLCSFITSHTAGRTPIIKVQLNNNRNNKKKKRVSIGQLDQHRACAEKVRGLGESRPPPSSSITSTS